MLKYGVGDFGFVLCNQSVQQLVMYTIASVFESNTYTSTGVHTVEYLVVRSVSFTIIIWN